MTGIRRLAVLASFAWLAAISPLYAAIQTVKTQDGGFSKTGAGWGSTAGQYSTNSWRNSANDAAQSASFAFTGLTNNAKVMVAIAFPNNTAYSAACPWSIIDSNGATVLASGTFTAKQESLHFAYGGVNWRWLAAVTPSATSLTVKFTANAGSSVYTIVDGVYVQDVTDAYDPASIASGNLSSASTWINGTIPANGTKAVIQHAVVVDTNTTIGTSGATGTTAITILGRNTGGTGTGGSLTVADGVTLTVRGDILLTCKDNTREAGYFPLQIGTGATGGASLVFDASQATTPLSQTYVVGPTATVQPDSQVRMRGTSSNFAAVSSNASGGNGYFTTRGFSTQTGQVDAQYVNFTRIGDSTNASFTSSLATTGNTFSLKNYTMTACGKIYHPGNLASNVNFILNDGLHTSTPGVCCTSVYTSTNAIGTGTREVKRCAFDKRFGDPVGGSSITKDFTYDKNLYEDGYAIADGNNVYWAAFTNCVIKKNFQDPKMVGDMTNCYIIDSVANNPHFFTLSATYACTADGLVFEYTGPGGDGDGIIPTPSPVSPLTYTVRNCLSLPKTQDANKPSSNIVSCLTGSANVKFNIYHNTYMFSNTTDHAVQLNETSATPAGAIQNFKSNLGWDTTARGNHFHTANRAGASVNDVIVAGSATNNCAYNGLVTPSGAQTECSAGYSNSIGTYYRTPTTVGTPGANDVNVNPVFADPTRNFAKWATTQGLAASEANTLSLLRLNLSVNIPAMITWVKDGFAPRHPALYKAGHDGGTIGAVAFNFAAFFNNNILRRSSNEPQPVPAWRDILDTRKRIRLPYAA